MKTLAFTTAVLVFVAASISVNKHIVDGHSMAPNYADKSEHYSFKIRWLEAPLPKRGDVVNAFINDSTPEVTFIKRVVAIPGDNITFSIDGRILLINSEKVIYTASNDTTRYIHGDSDYLASAGVLKDVSTLITSSVYVEQYGKTHYKVMLLNASLDEPPVSNYIQAKRLSGTYDKFSYNEKQITNVIVPKGHYLLLSDNRTSGYDSRSAGFIPITNIYRVIDHYDQNR